VRQTNVVESGAAGASSGPIVVGIKDGELRVWRRDEAGNWIEQIGTDPTALLALLVAPLPAEGGKTRAKTETDAGPLCDVVLICRGTPKLPPPDPAVKGLMEKVQQLTGEVCGAMERVID
jgi:hypothetical protein